VVERRKITKLSNSKAKTMPGKATATPVQLAADAKMLKFSICPGTRKAINEAREQAAQAGQNLDLAEHAAVIRRLGRRVITDIIEIGRRLCEAKKLVRHGDWEAWLEKEFGWSADTALNFMRVYELSKSRNFRDLNIAPSALYLLAKKSTPEPVRTESIERAEAGEAITVKDVKALKTELDKPTVVKGLQQTADDEQCDADDDADADADTEQATANPTNNWREDLRRRFRDALKVANDVIGRVEQVPPPNAVIDPELRQQMREVWKPQRSELSEIREAGQRLLDYASFVENILTDVEPLAEAAE
jgi:hypothetical protein